MTLVINALEAARKKLLTLKGYQMAIMHLDAAIAAIKLNLKDK